LRLLQLCAAAVLCTLFVSSLLPRLLSGERGYDVVPDRLPGARPGPAVDAGASFGLGGDGDDNGNGCPPAAPGARDGLTVVLKIGAGEVATQLPHFLAHRGRCPPDLLVFSDRRDTCRGVDVADALAHLRPEYRFNNADFDIYDRLQRADDPSNVTAAKTDPGWRLDKYKFLPMMEWTSYLRPASQWYIFVELDTYLNYDNLARFLARFSPHTAHYFGSPVWPRKKIVFAHGGSGFVLSRAALDKVMALGRMFGENKHFPGTHFFGVDVQKHCCGDEVLAHVLKKSGVPLRGYWPMFNGENPFTVRYGPEQWCEAIITMHHMHDRDFAALAQWERARENPARPLIFEELFTMVEPLLRDMADNWSNMSDDVTYPRGKSPAKSFDTCFKACQNDARCLQFEHSGIDCRLGYSIRLGHQQRPDGDRTWTSGWMMSRIQAFKQARSPCQGAHFVYSNP